MVVSPLSDATRPRLFCRCMKERLQIDRSCGKLEKSAFLHRLNNASPPWLTRWDREAPAPDGPPLESALPAAEYCVTLSKQPPSLSRSPFPHP